MEWDAVPDKQDALDQVRATDNSDSLLELTVEEVTASSVNVHEYTMVRTFTAVDDCGNSNISTQTVSVDDTVAPTLNDEPADITVDCDAVPPACTLNAIGEPTLTVDFTEEVLTSPERHVRTWSVEDEAANVETYSQTITLVDNAAPVLSRTPADATVSCSCEEFPAPPAVIAMDNCDTNVNVTYSQVKSPDLETVDEYTLTRSWSAADTAGNTVTHTQTITVEDNDAPALYPDPVSLSEDVECSVVPEAPTVSVLDNCDGTVTVDVTSVETSVVCDNTYTILRTYSSTDRTGNSFAAVQTVGVSDVSAPAIQSLEDGCVMEGGSNSVTYTFDELFSTTDDCSSPTLTLAYCNTTDAAATVSCAASADGQGITLTGTFVAPLTFTVAMDATDVCGNDASSTADVVIHSETSAAVAGAEDCKSTS